MERSFALTPGKRVLYLTKDPERIRRQLAGTLTLSMRDLSPDELLDDINTDAMTPAWVCFDHDPAQIAKNAYAGLVVGGQRLIAEDALAGGGFEVIVSGAQKGNNPPLSMMSAVMASWPAVNSDSGMDSPASRRRSMA